MSEDYDRLKAQKDAILQAGGDPVRAMAERDGRVMTKAEAVVYLSSLRSTALSSRNQTAVSALNVALDALVGYDCGCGHSRARHTACEVKICGCRAYHSRLTETGSATDSAGEASASPGRSASAKENPQLVSPLPQTALVQHNEEDKDFSAGLRGKITGRD